MQICSTMQKEIQIHWWEENAESGYSVLHGLSRGGQSSLSSSFGSLGLFLCSSLLASLGHLGQLVMIQLGFNKGFKVACAQALVICLSNGRKELVQVFNSIA